MKQRLTIVFFFFSLIHLPCVSAKSQTLQTLNDSLLHKLLINEDPLLDEVINNPSRYEFQLIYTKVRKERNGFVLEERSLNKDSFHFYPASLIKFPLSIVAMENIYKLQTDGTGAGMQNKIRLKTCSCDKTSNSYVQKSKNPILEQFLREMLIMSDNDAYNLFFDLVGIDRCNTRMREMGYDGIILKSRFVAGCGLNRLSGGFEFLNESDSVIYSMACDSSVSGFSVGSKYPTASGRYHYEGKKRVAGPKDYSGSNFVRLADAHSLMMRLFYPQISPDSAAMFRFDGDYRQMLKSALGDFPRELLLARQDFSKTPDHYYKFFLDPKVMNTQNGNLRIYNKVGLASGYLCDVSYFEDKENDVSFFLSAAIFAKKDGIVGGGQNNYFDLGMPVLRKIGSLIYNYELALKCRQ